MKKLICSIIGSSILSSCATTPTQQSTQKFTMKTQGFVVWNNISLYEVDNNNMKNSDVLNMVKTMNIDSISDQKLVCQDIKSCKLHVEQVNKFIKQQGNTATTINAYSPGFNLTMIDSTESYTKMSANMTLLSYISVVNGSVKKYSLLTTIDKNFTFESSGYFGFIADKYNPNVEQSLNDITPYNVNKKYVISIKPSKINSNFLAKGDVKYISNLVFSDNGVQSILKFNDDTDLDGAYMYLIGRDGENIMVNYRLKDNQLIIDNVIGNNEHLVLQLSNKENIEIFKGEK